MILSIIPFQNILNKKDFTLHILNTNTKKTLCKINLMLATDLRPYILLG